MGVALIAITLFGAWFLAKTWKLYRNYQAAAKSGLPCLIWPVDPENVRSCALTSKPAGGELTLPS